MLGWNQVHYYCGHYWPAKYMITIVMAIGGINGRGNGSTPRKPAPVPLRPTQIPHDLTRVRTRAAEVTNRLSYGTAYNQ
jgi:hypothetical protein